MRVAVVTGASGGIGRWIALGLARAGHHVVLVCRDRARGEATAAWIAREAPDSRTELVLADLRCLREARQAGLAVAAAHPRVSLLVNNAGLFTSTRQTTPEGREAVLAVNHLAPHVLADALENTLVAGAPSRIINIGSSTSDHATIDPQDLELRRGWGMRRAYGRSKLALMTATFVRAERLRGSGVVAHVVHPGLVATGLIKEGGAIGLAWRTMGLFARSEAQGAAPPLHACLAPEFGERTGCYIKDRGSVQANKLARDPAFAARVEGATRALVTATLGSSTARRSSTAA